MEKELGRIKFTETDIGVRIEITGEKLKEKLAACCIPLCCGAAKVDRGDSGAKKKGSEKRR